MDSRHFDDEHRIRRTSLKVRSVYILTVIFLVFFVLPLNATQEKKWTIGFQGGWSLGSINQNRELIAASSSLDFTNQFYFHLGSYIQYDFSDFLALQFNINCQIGRYYWDLFVPMSPAGYDEKTYGIFSFSLNGVYNIIRWKKAELYVIGGGGLNLGNWWSFNGVYFNTNFGLGSRIHLSQRTALNFGSSFHFLFENQPEAVSIVIDNAFYCRIFFGVEFII